MAKLKGLPTGLILVSLHNPGTEVPGPSGISTASPVGTTESSPADEKRFVGGGHRCFSTSIVPMGLVLVSLHYPGTEVPGYFPGVPTGRKITKLEIYQRIYGTEY